MTIHYVKGNIFESEAVAIVNPVNCVGVMGRGLALQFRNHFPNVYERYRHVCIMKKLRPGILQYTDGGGKTVINFPTKDHWRQPSELEYIELGLKNFRKNYVKRRITSVAFPPLGCGLGGLNWNDVRELMERYLGDLKIDIYIYEP